jgi:hypothetical protein
MEELKQLAAVIEGLCRKLQAEPEYREATFVAQTMLTYTRTFEQRYLALLAGECKAQATASVSGSPRGRESDGEPEPSYFSASV